MSEPTEQPQHQPKRKRLPPTRRFPIRLYASKDTADAVELAMIDVSHRLRSAVPKAEISDACAVIGARHLEEVAEYIREQRSKEDA